MIRGSVGDCDLRIALVDKLQDEDKDDLDGRARKKQKSQELEIELDAALDGRALFNTLLHECLHLMESVYGWEARHEEVWILASGLSQALISTGIIVPAEFEARIRRLMAESGEK